ncbi:carbonic anhydrase 7-like [Penaeus japonicus]|uniref:carbonic anhydrase 7-like n=1 Tax=Penaeus japonicus TaxID=27405 RepID=UPI001C7162B1|nr:carbonic anhydrase 7-like [Penaeus japonicus]
MKLSTRNKSPIAPTAGPPAAPEWGYKGEGGPENWATLFPNFCAGSSQSPIALNGLEATATSSSDAWVLEKYDTVPDDMKIENNGHSAKVAWTVTNTTDLPSVSGGELGGKYTFAQFHFHWGSISTQGSEHTINGIAYAAELHLVHFKTEYGSLGNAIAYEDGLAALHYAPWRNTKSKCGYIVNVMKNTWANEASARPSCQRTPTPFLQIPRSLTTPTCNEIVTWTVFQDPITISESQLEQFRGLLGDDGEHHIEDNYRPVLPLNGRTVEKITVS